MEKEVDIQTLRLFLAIADMGNISKAATVYGLSQSSVSRSLRNLEQALKTQLFHRIGHGVQPTAIGALAIQRARLVIGTYENFVSDIREQGYEINGVVTVALLTAYMRSSAHDLFKEVREKYPRIMLHLVENFSAQHERWLANGQVDIALISKYQMQNITEVDVLAQSNLNLVGQQPLRIEKGGKIQFHNLDELPLVLPATPNSLRLRLEEEARKQHIKLNVLFEADSLEAQLALVRKCPCYAIWSEHLIKQENYGAEFYNYLIIEPILPRYIVLRTTAHHPLSRAAREVALVLRRIISSSTTSN